MRLTSSTQDTYLKNLYAFQEQLLDDDDSIDAGNDDDIDEMSATDFYRKRNLGAAGPARTPNKKKRTQVRLTQALPH